MSVFTMMTETCEVVRYDEDGTDALNRPIKTETSRTEYRCRLEHRASSEGNEDTSSYSANVWRLYLLAGADILAGDTVEADGRVFTVEGTPIVMKTPRGPLYVVADLQHNQEVTP